MIKRLIPNRVKELLLQQKLTLGKSVLLSKGVHINKYSFFEGHNSLLNYSQFTNSYIGFGSYIATNSVIRYARIGRFTAIGDNVRTGLGLHPTQKFVSIHPAFFSLEKQAGFTFAEGQIFEEHKYVDPERKYTCSIGNDVWIGNNVLIMDGITIGNGAVIAAGAVVTKNVPSYEIYAGVPAKLIKKRFTDDQILRLLKIEWWNWDFEKIRRCSSLFSDIEKFIKENDDNLGK
jgi:acetyltransferase-like isoleucine patch superfamily enzyme